MVVMAPSTFGNFHGDILVGDFGDGRINAFTPAGVLRGQLKSETSAPIDISGLWGLRFGNCGAGGDANSLFFSAGINDEADGLFRTSTGTERAEGRHVRRSQLSPTAPRFGLG